MLAVFWAGIPSSVLFSVAVLHHFRVFTATQTATLILINMGTSNIFFGLVRLRSFPTISLCVHSNELNGIHFLNHCDHCR